MLPAPCLHNFGVGALKPTASSPIIVRSPADSKVTITNDLTVSGLDYVRLQGLHLVGQASSLSFSSVSGPALASCVVSAPVTFSACADPEIIGNTFDYRTSAETVTLTNCTGARIRNNVFWNDGVEPGLTWTGTAPDSDYNLYYPADISPAETNSICVAPGIHSTDYYVLGSASAAFTNKGVVESAFQADVQGWYRHLSFPCRGAFEYQIIENSGVDANGRVTGRTIAGRPHTLSYDTQGRLTGATSLDGTSVTYEYDHLGRRVLTTHSSPLTTHQTRMVYDGTDVVADIVDEDGDGTVDRRRLYWILPQIDQRIGFVDIEGGEARAYYYVTDQVGSVLQVLDSSGAVVNQYNYDAWGNLLKDGTFENVPNRYRFQGREWDERLQAYYFRYRMYFPETGTFSGPDPVVELGATGAGNYLAFENDPPSNTDALGLFVGLTKPLSPEGKARLEDAISRLPSIPAMPQKPGVWARMGGWLWHSAAVKAEAQEYERIAFLHRAQLTAAKWLLTPKGSIGSPDTYNPAEVWEKSLVYQAKAEGRSRYLKDIAVIGGVTFVATAVDLATLGEGKALVDLVEELGKARIRVGKKGIRWILTRGGKELTEEDAILALRTARNASTSAASFLDDLAAQATRNGSSNKVVLGKWLEGGISYTKVAAHYRASYFKLQNWRELTQTLTRDQIWEINKAFLRQQIRAGKQIILSHNPANATGFFLREVAYLEDLGYRFVADGWAWKAVR